MYLRNSQASRVLPMPAGPMTDTSRARPSRLVAWNRSLSRRSSSSRPTNGASSVSARFRPPTLGDDPERPPGRDRAVLPLRICSPACSKTIALLGGALGRLADEDRARAAATDWSRLAVLTRSPATMPWFVAPIVTAASPVRTPARAWMPGPRVWTASTSSRAARTARSASSSWAVGAPQTAITASPMNFSTVPAVAVDDVARQVEVAAQELAGVLRVASFGEGREADEVGEQDGDQATLGDRLRGGAADRRFGDRRTGEPCATFAAELCVSRDRRTARRTAAREWLTAFDTELAAGLVDLAALCTGQRALQGTRRRAGA